MAYTGDNPPMPASDPVTPGAPPHPLPFVREELGTRSMHFSDAAIQSPMDLMKPAALALEYTRTMMGLLLFDPSPARVAMIGLGGGSLVRFFARHLPRTELTVVEINADVIALRDRFALPPDGPRLRIVHADGARWVSATTQRFDVLLIDAFDAECMPEAFGTRRFYDDCHDVLVPGGLLVANLHASHPHLPLYLERLGAAMGNLTPTPAWPVLRVDDRDGSNSVVFARRGAPLVAQRGAPPALAELHDAYSRIAHALQRTAAAREP